MICLQNIFRFFEFLNTKFTLYDFTISFFEIMVFGIVAYFAGYIIGTFFRR